MKNDTLDSSSLIRQYSVNGTGIIFTIRSMICFQHSPLGLNLGGVVYATT